MDDRLPGEQPECEILAPAAGPELSDQEAGLLVGVDVQGVRPFLEDPGAVGLPPDGPGGVEPRGQPEQGDLFVREGRPGSRGRHRRRPFAPDHGRPGSDGSAAPASERATGGRGFDGSASASATGPTRCLGRRSPGDRRLGVALPRADGEQAHNPASRGGRQRPPSDRGPGKPSRGRHAGGSTSGPGPDGRAGSSRPSGHRRPGGREESLKGRGRDELVRVLARSHPVPRTTRPSATSCLAPRASPGRTPRRQAAPSIALPSLLILGRMGRSSPIRADRREKINGISPPGDKSLSDSSILPLFCVGISCVFRIDIPSLDSHGGETG